MERYKIKDVPNQKKISYIWFYYRWHIIGVMFTMICMGYLAHATWFAAKTDASILWLSSQYDLVTDDVVKKRLEELSCDVNIDGETTIAVQHISFSGSYETMPAEEKMTLLTLIASGDFNILFVNEEAKNWAKEQEILASWKNLGFSSEDEFSSRKIDLDTTFCVPCKELSFFEDTDMTSYEEMYLVAALPPTEKTELEKYRIQMQAVYQILTWRN